MNENVKKWWAEKIDGREYGSELTRLEEMELKELGLVVVFGASDDLCEFNGAIDDEVGCFGGEDIYINAEGLIANNMDMFDSFIPKNSPDFALIKACWDCDGYSWAYETDIPHESFEIFEDGDPYCRGIVFSIADMPKGECVK